MAAAIVGVVLTSLAFPARAPAQTSASAPVTGGSWYWQEQVGSVSTPNGPVAPPSALPTPDVPSGDFPVSVVAGQPDKESFLQVDSSAIPAGSTVSSLVLTLHEDPGAQGQLNASTATVEARAVTGFMAGGDAGRPWANRPQYDTTGPAAPGKRSADGSWTFELAPIAARWTSGELSNNGIALVPANPQQGQAYEVVWFGPGGARAPSVAGSYTPPAAGSPQAGAAGIPSTAPLDQGAAPVSITPDNGPSTAISPPGLSSSPATPSAPATAAAPAAGNRITASSARPIESSHRAPPWAFYLAVLAVIALIAASSLTLGDLGEPEPERQGGVLRTLERRQEVQEVPT
ncbi:MAG: DNRLRE domain-containing protein [Acidimicrobiia bacterium]|nr:DNRLRE domain-containing protein [Acidimicrobiia bacterium]